MNSWLNVQKRNKGPGLEKKRFSTVTLRTMTRTPEMFRVRYHLKVTM